MLPVVTKILTKAKVEKLSQDKERAMVFGPHLKNDSYFGTSTRKGSDIVVTSFFCTKAAENDKQFMFPNWVDWYPWSLSDVVLLHCDDWMLFCSVYPDIYVGFNGICIHFHITERKIDYLHWWRVTLSGVVVNYIVFQPLINLLFFLFKGQSHRGLTKCNNSRISVLITRNFAHKSDWMKCLADHWRADHCESGVIFQQWLHGDLGIVFISILTSGACRSLLHG